MHRPSVGHDTWCGVWSLNLLPSPVFKRRSLHLLISIAVALSLGALSPAGAADYSFTTIDVPGASQTFARGINNVDQIVGQFFNGAIHGYRLSEGSFISVDVPGAALTIAHGINTAGQIVGIFNSGLQHGFLRNTSGSFTVVDVPGVNFTEVRGINTSGQIVGWFADAAGRGHGFLLSGGSFTALNVPSVVDTFIFGINDSGQMVGYVNTGAIGRGLLVSGDTFTTFDAPGAISTVANGINNAGQIVGTFQDAARKQHGFVRDASGAFTTIDPPGSLLTDARGINDAGDIVGWFGDSRGQHGFVAKRSGDCTDQVVVNNFSAQTTTGINAIIRNDTLTLFTQTNPHAPHPRVGDHGPRPGIAFTADVTINDGPIPISEIHMRYIQNLTGWNGSLVYQPKPDALLALGTSITLPILDQATQPPPAAYDNDFDETDPTGPARVVTATDSPILFAIALTLLEPVRNLQSVDVEKTFTMFLGCYADQDPTFRTLSTLDWRALYTGTVNQGSRTTFTQGADAGITAQPSVPSTQSPVQDAPLANDDGVLIQVEGPS